MQQFDIRVLFWIMTATDEEAERDHSLTEPASMKAL